MTAGGSSVPEVQRLLAVLAAGRRAAEIGTAYGEGALAMAATAREVVTVELDPERAEQARTRLSACPNVTLLVGDWRELLPAHGPFEFVFADGGSPYDWDAILSLVERGGLIVKDDLTPGRPVEGDPVREFLLGDRRVAVVEILTTPSTSAIIAVRL